MFFNSNRNPTPKDNQFRDYHPTCTIQIGRRINHTVQMEWAHFSRLTIKALNFAFRAMKTQFKIEMNDSFNFPGIFL